MLEAAKKILVSLFKAMVNVSNYLMDEVDEKVAAKVHLNFQTL